MGGTVIFYTINAATMTIETYICAYFHLLSMSFLCHRESQDALGVAVVQLEYDEYDHSLVRCVVWWLARLAVDIGFLIPSLMIQMLPARPLLPRGCSRPRISPLARMVRTFLLGLAPSFSI